METFETQSVEETLCWGGQLAKRLGVGDCVALQGPLGAGKTALVRGIALGLGLTDERMVSSPSYVLVQEYAARIPIYHVDLYRLTEPNVELADLGLAEMLADGVVFIEWADRAGQALPRPYWQIQIEPTGPDSRRLCLQRIN